VVWEGWEQGRAGLTFQYITILTVHILFECQYFGLQVSSRFRMVCSETAIRLGAQQRAVVL
jgi:hypothetical protein